MKKSKKTALTAAIFATAMNFTACTSPDVDVQTEYGAPIATPEETYQPEEEMPQDVYGPPEYFDSTTEQETAETLEEVSEEPETENPPEETGENLEALDEESEPETPETTKKYNPRINIPQTVYGPPRYYDNPIEEEPSENLEEPDEESEPEDQPEEAIEEYEPKMEMPRLVYGPPEAFEGE